METVRSRYKVDRRDIMYLRATIESYDGMAVVRTLDPGEAVIELLIAPGCQDSVKNLIEDLNTREGIKLESPWSA
jgi:hypothetical protein